MSRSRSAAEATWSEAAPVFAALADPTRLRIVARLCVEGPLSITHLSEGADVSRQAITRHLRALASVGLAHDRRDGPDGRERIWELDPKKLDRARRCLDHISSQWDRAIDRLKALVEDEDENGHPRSHSR